MESLAIKKISGQGARKIVERIESVRIIYNDRYRNFFNFFAELYRMDGLYVEERLLEGDRDIAEEKDTAPRSLSLCIAPPGAPKYDDIFYIDPTELGQWDMSCNDMRILEPVSHITACLQEWTLDRDLQFPWETVQQILPVYIKNNVLRGAMQLQYYRMKTELHEETEQIFMDALAELEELEMKSANLTYAKIYCKQKANLSCYFQVEKPLHFAISALVMECDNLIEQCPDFSNAKVLKGMVCERAFDGLKLAIDSYKDALLQIGDRSYASHIYYWVGLLYEKFAGSHSDAAYAYTRSYQLRKKYRNTYKMGFMAEQEENYKEAVACYKECVELLEERIRGNMDPLEIEYYFKTGVLVCFHSQRYLEDYGQAIQYGKRMLNFYDREFSDTANSHFRYFYGPDAERYQKISERRLKCKRLYECLAIAYRESGDNEKSMEYWNLSEKIEL